MAQTWLHGSDHLGYLMCIGGNTTPDPPTPDIPMSQVSITIDSAVLESFEKLFTTLKAQVENQPATVANNEPEELTPFNEFLSTELKSHFGEEMTQIVITNLKRSCAIGDYRYLIPTYKMLGEDLQKRQLLKLVSAVHRYKFGGYRNPEKYSLKSEIKYAKACPLCGELAGKLYDRLVKENLI